MLATWLTFVPVALVLTITPGAATAMVVRSAAHGGRPAALRTTIGNSLGIFAWGLLAAVGIAAVVATSVEAFTVVKLAGAVALVAMGVRSLLARDQHKEAQPAATHGRCARSAPASSQACSTQSSRSSSSRCSRSSCPTARRSSRPPSSWPRPSCASTWSGTRRSRCWSPGRAGVRRGPVAEARRAAHRGRPDRPRGTGRARAPLAFRLAVKAAVAVGVVAAVGDRGVCGDRVGALGRGAGQVGRLIRRRRAAGFRVRREDRRARAGGKLGCAVVRHSSDAVTARGLAWRDRNADRRRALGCEGFASRAGRRGAASATRASSGALPRARSSLRRCWKAGANWPRPQAIPISASRCSGSPVRAIPPRRRTVEDS